MDSLNGKSRKQHNMIESTSREIINKLSKLDQLFDQFSSDELLIRDQLRKNCSELGNEVDLIETKQRKIQDCLKNLQGI